MNRRKYGFFIITALLFINILVIINQLNAQIITSKDWVKVSDTSSFSPRSLHQVVVFKDKLYLIGGRCNSDNINDVWCSADGINWIQLSNKIEIPVDHGASVVVFKDKLWLNTGKDIWNSSDGIKWNKVTTVNELPKYGKNMAVFKNKIWLTGGWDNGHKDDVWSSEDGINWIKVKTTNCFSKRSDHSVVVFKNKIWLIAGQSGLNKNDVWCSEDCINWTKVTDAPFTPRHVTQAVVFENKLWVIAGFAMDSTNQPIMLSDVWSSPDGKNWENVTSSAPFGRRQEHQAVAFKNKLWVIGGYSGTFNNRIYKNDSWYTQSSSADIKSSVRQKNYPKATLRWFKKNNLPENMVLETVTIKNKIYCLKMGSFDTKKNGEVYIYNPGQDTLIKIADMPTCKAAFEVITLDNKIYVIGGMTGFDNNGKDVRSNTVEIFDPSNSSWSTASDMLTGITFPAAGVYNGKLYVIGAKFNSNIQNIVQEYDPLTDKWTRKADSPPALFYWGSAVIKDNMYGIDEQGHVAVYSFLSDKWETNRSSMTARSEFGTVVINNKIFVLGGWTSMGKYVSDLIEMYDPIEDKWIKLEKMPIPKYYIHPAVLNNEVYIIGGIIRGWGSELGSLDCNSVELFEAEFLNQGNTSEISTKK